MLTGLTLKLFWEKSLKTICTFTIPIQQNLIINLPIRTVLRYSKRIKQANIKFVRQEQIRKKEAEAAAQRKEVEAQSGAQLKRIEALGDADALKIQKSAEAESYRMQAMAEAEEMRMKGYTYQEETSRQIGLEAMKNGISSEGGSLPSGNGDTWACSCGARELTGNFCPQCGASKPNQAQTWDCARCGKKGLTGNFCPECGAKRPG